MTVTVQKTDGKIATVYWDVKSVEETPTFLKITGDDITLIPLRDILEVYIGDVENDNRKDIERHDRGFEKRP